jgi:hypothetical protein
MERKQAEERRTYGRLCATVANFAAFVEKKKALTAEDFYPDQNKRREPQNVDDQIEFLSGLMGCGPSKPGTVN